MEDFVQLVLDTPQIRCQLGEIDISDLIVRSTMILDEFKV